jgi:hypothetical protein
MTEEEKIPELEQMEEQVEQAEGGPGKATVSEEIKVQAQDLFKAVNDLIRESTVRRITIMRNDRVWVDIPLIVGIPVGVVLATQLPVISSVAAVGALLGGFTLRVEREEPTEET